MKLIYILLAILNLIVSFLWIIAVLQTNNYGNILYVLISLGCVLLCMIGVRKERTIKR